MNSKKLFENLNIRKAVKCDLLQYYNWANDPAVRAASFDSNLIDIKSHEKWFAKRIEAPDTYLYFFETDLNPVGQVRFEKDDIAIISLSVDKEYRGLGLAYKLLELAINEFRIKESAQIHAYIRKDNQTSVKAFEKVGFKFFRDDYVNNIPCYIFKYDN